MIDYLFSFPDEATAHAMLDGLGFGFPPSPDGEGGMIPARWDSSRCLQVQIIVGQKQVGTDEAGQPIMAPVYAGGFWLAIGAAQPDDALYAIPYCMREADRDRAEAGLPYVNRERFTAEQLAAPWSISPQWCGVDYSNSGSL